MKGKGNLKTIIVMIILLLVGVLGVLGMNSIRTYMGGATAGCMPVKDSATGRYKVDVKPLADGKGVSIAWQSQLECYAYVQYGTTPQAILVNTDKETQKSTSHQVKITSLASTGNTRNYYFRIRSSEKEDNPAEWEMFDNEGIPFSFPYEGNAAAVPEVTPAVTVAPQVSSVPSSASGTPSKCVAGQDYNGDGSINSLDMINCLKNGGTQVVPQASSTPASVGGCDPTKDFDGNGTVNALDLIKCRQSQ
jgi:hypothetical protein